MKNRDWSFIGSLLFLGIILVLVMVSIWARIAAPCDKIDWMPVRDLPGRCVPALTGGQR